MASIGKLALVLTADTAALASSLAKAGSMIKDFAGQSLKFAAGGDLLGLAKSIPYLGPVVAGVEALAGPVLQLAAGAEMAKLRFTALTGSGEKATEVLAGLKTLSLSSGFGMSQLEPAARHLATAGLEADYLVPTMQALAGVSAITGDSVEGLAEHISHMAAKGHVAGRDLNSFRPLLPQIAANAGVTADKLREMFESGALGPKDLLKALGDLTQEGGKFAGALGDRAKTMTGAWEIASVHLKDIASEMGKTLVGGFSEGFGEGDAGAGLISFLDSIKATVAELRPTFAWLGQAARESIAFFQVAWEDFGAPTVAALKGSLSGLGVNFDGLGVTVLHVFEGVGISIAYVVDAAKFLWGAFSVGLGGWVGLIAKIIGAFANLADTIAALADGVAAAFSGVGKFLGEVLTKPITNALVWIIDQVGGLLSSIAGRLGDKAPAWMKGTLDTLGAAKDQLGKGIDIDVGAPFRNGAKDLRDFQVKADKMADVLIADGDAVKAAFGLGPDAVRDWFAKVRDRAADPLGGGPGEAPAAKLDLGAGIANGLGKHHEIKLSGANLEGSKEAASVIAKYQTGQAMQQAAKQRAEHIQVTKELKAGVARVENAVKAINQVRIAVF